MTAGIILTIINFVTDGTAKMHSKLRRSTVAYGRGGCRPAEEVEKGVLDSVYS